MRRKAGTDKPTAERVVKDIRRKTREDLQAYNDLITKSFIDIPSLQEPVLEISKELPPGASGDVDDSWRIRIGDTNTRTRRIFSSSSWYMHGRFYGG